jgi:serpin B
VRFTINGYLRRGPVGLRKILTVKRPLLGLVITVVAMAAVACASTSEPAIAQSDEERILAPEVSEADFASLTSQNREFALDLYQVLSEEPGNLFLSPHSISIALAMTYAGARGDTESEMAEALHFGLPQQDLHLAFNRLDLELAKRSDTEPDNGGDPPRLNIANSTWGQDGFEFLDDYLDTLALNYGAGLRLSDFASDPEGARQTINKWVSEQTEDRIPELIPAGLIDNFTTLVLANAIYFNASWAVPFLEESTREGTFHLLDGSEVAVPMMGGEGPATAHASVDGIEVVEIPYAGGEMSFVVLLPPEGQLSSFESSLDASFVDELIGELKSGKVDLRMPRFGFDSDLDLKAPLKALGMTSAFDPLDADLTGINREAELYITSVVHSSFVSVDESGTEAAAATAVIVGDVSAGQSVIVDRPFIFLIRDIPTDTILFLGRVVDPSS